MPVEIKELLIKAVVSDTTKQAQQSAPTIDIVKIKKEVIKECVQEVLQQLKIKNER